MTLIRTRFSETTQGELEITVDRNPPGIDVLQKIVTTKRFSVKQRYRSNANLCEIAVEREFRMHRHGHAFRNDTGTIRNNGQNYVKTSKLINEQLISVLILRLNKL